MIRLMLLFLLIGCGKVTNGENGFHGLNGDDGLSYYSYLHNVNIQRIVGEEHRPLVLEESNYYQLPKSFSVNVDNEYTECQLRDFKVVFETDSGREEFIFKPTENRYRMELKSGPVNKLVDTSKLIIYYESVPEVDCGDTVYRLHSGVTFEVRVIQRLEI